MRKIGNILLLLLISGIFLYSGFLLWKKYQPAPIQYEIVESGYGNLERLTVFTGRIVPNEEVEIKAFISGVLKEIYISEGDYVNKGDVIARLEVIPDIKSISAAQAAVNNAAIVLDEQKKIYERNKLLHSKSVISDSEMEKINASYQIANQSFSNAEENLNIIKHGYNQRTQTGNIQVRSTISGIVLTIPTKKASVIVPANILNKGTTIASIGDIRTSEFVFDVDEMEIDHLYINMPIKLTLGVDNSIKIDGNINNISFVGKEVKGTTFYEVKASIHVPENVLIPTRSSASAEISIAKKENVILVPESTISFENDSTFVYLVEKGFLKKYIFTKQYVELGLSDKINVEVLSGIEKANIQIRGNQIVEK